MIIIDGLLFDIDIIFHLVGANFSYFMYCWVD